MNESMTSATDPSDLLLQKFREEEEEQKALKRQKCELTDANKELEKRLKEEEEKLKRAEDDVENTEALIEAGEKGIRVLSKDQTLWNKNVKDIDEEANANSEQQRHLIEETKSATLNHISKCVFP